jgi:hypothetical protein
MKAHRIYCVTLAVLMFGAGLFLSLEGGTSNPPLLVVAEAASLPEVLVGSWVAARAESIMRGSYDRWEISFKEDETLKGEVSSQTGGLLTLSGKWTPKDNSVTCDATITSGGPGLVGQKYTLVLELHGDTLEGTVLRSWSGATTRIAFQKMK